MTEGNSGVDQSKPSIARVYDCLLGGKDHYVVDRAVGETFKHDMPGSVAIAHANRQNLVRAVRELALAGIDQFIDMGSGLPTADNVHQVAQRQVPDARVVYIDSDPIVLAHGRALLEGHAHTRVLQADVRDPQAIREHPDTVELIDFDRPVAVVLSAILHHLNDDEDPRALVRYWQEQVPSGSYFFISHFRSGDNPQTAEAEAVLQSTFGRGRWRSDAEIRALFGDLEILEPGIVPSSLWRPDVASDPLHAGAAEAELTVWEQLIVGGLAWKA
ncbi:SAM-dependent methyltransferase [Streptomyces benahoarensis]|uniref:SAM-dependent methyltransferase n=1 Tax=Streptomyces benahoarensis TaxID=2595054 RepID=A0A553YY39_9ACTN|nr:SAM-dependent methyltransferase [Streptomyces benahoarensis]TSB21474.1 SAM-dependent methyltransferase [Streptomyces benahoarensis]TSB33893.1 SAM-dependent methyltransferase [Streptomyces benahoarensis]